MAGSPSTSARVWGLFRKGAAATRRRVSCLRQLLSSPRLPLRRCTLGLHRRRRESPRRRLSTRDSQTKRAARTHSQQQTTGVGQGSLFEEKLRDSPRLQSGDSRSVLFGANCHTPFNGPSFLLSLQLLLTDASCEEPGVDSPEQRDPCHSNASRVSRLWKLKLEFLSFFRLTNPLTR